MALDDKTIPDDWRPEPNIEREVRGRLREGLLSCADAFAAAERLELPPARIGRTMDALRLRLTECQIGVFGYPGHAKGWAAAGSASRPVPPGLEADLLAAAGADGSISCLAIWRAAASHGLGRMQAGFIADKLKLRIKGCQLGAF